MFDQMTETDTKQFEKILSYIEHGKREGATLLTGGKQLGSKGFYVEPTIFTDVKVNSLENNYAIEVPILYYRHWIKCLF